MKKDVKTRELSRIPTAQNGRNKKKTSIFANVFQPYPNEGHKDTRKKNYKHRLRAHLTGTTRPSAHL